MKTNAHWSRCSGFVAKLSRIDVPSPSSHASNDGVEKRRPYASAVLVALACLVLGTDSRAANQSEVTFKVMDETGNPVTALEVVLSAVDKSDKSLGNTPWTAKTSKKGTAVFPFLPYNGQGEGRYAISMKKEGYFIQKFNIVSRQLQSGEQGRGTLIQEDAGTISPRQQDKIPALRAKPGGTATIELTIAPVGSTASTPPSSTGGEGVGKGGTPAVPTAPVEAAPTDPITNARILMQGGKLAEAEEALKKLEQSTPSAEVDYELARVYHLEKKDSEQKAALKAALAKDASFPKAHYELGKMLYEEGRTAEAITEFEAEIKAHSDDAGSESGLAALYMEVGRPSDAIKLYEKIVADNPDNTDALVSLDGLYTTQGDHKKSEEAYKKIVALNPTGAEQVYYKAGSNISKRSDLGEADRSRAAAAFRKAVELNPKFAKAHRELGFALLALGKLEEAKTHFKAYLELEPTAKDAATIRQFLQGG